MSSGKGLNTMVSPWGNVSYNGKTTLPLGGSFEFSLVSLKLTWNDEGKLMLLEEEFKGSLNDEKW